MNALAARALIALAVAASTAVAACGTLSGGTASLEEATALAKSARAACR